MNNIIAVTMGDPAGIGLEIIIKSLSEAGLAGAPVVVVGCVRTLRRIMAMNITPQAELRVIQKVCDAHFAPGVINVMDEPLANPDALTPGVVQAAAGDLAYRCIKRATALALSGEVKAIATAPLNKEALHLGGHNYPGIRNCWPILPAAKSTRWCSIPISSRLSIFRLTSHCVNSWIL